ncbi:MAG: nuclear transport factor 2 family protein [Deltaproteobacteria bacterium]|nr:nuclear transport factor 2 family protein [Deltaproteobacteria bacterium]
MEGNRPEELIEAYAQDVYYRDPAKPEGVRGKAALLEYFRKLLKTFPEWVWTAEEVFPIEGGFVLRWKARIPVGSMIVQENGMDLVLVEGGLVTRNEVYFDRAALLAAMEEQARGNSSRRSTDGC